MAKIELTNKQLRLIQKALDFYSRIGSLQFEEILNHPTIDNAVIERFSPHKKFEVGDHTMKGEIVEIGDGFIKTKGNWGKGEEIKTWIDVEKVKPLTKLAPNWPNVHKTNDEIIIYLNKIKFLISGEDGNYGIYDERVDETCRESYDMIQIIRHEFWKENPNKSAMTVDSSYNLIHPNEAITVKLDDIKDHRKRKLKNIIKSTQKRR